MSDLEYGRKFCTDCRTLKPLSEFYLNKEGKFGVVSWCKECYKKYAKKHKEANPEKEKERHRKYYEANPEKKKESHRKWREANPFKNTIRMIKGRSMKKEIPFDLDIEYLKQLWEICGGICSMTGVPMLKISEEGHGKDPFVMSVDRIISEKGYTKGNVRLVCMWYNNARSNNDDKFTLEMFQRTIDHAYTIASVRGNASHKSQ